MSENSRKLFVDLDGTLIQSDLLLESFLNLLRSNALYLLLVPLWLFQGKANLKHQIASRTAIRADLLPFNAELLDFLQQEKESGRELILISASNHRFVQQVADHIGLFDQAIGSTETNNLKGAKKLAEIARLSGEQPFDYAGNDKSDLKVWSEAGGAVLVNVPSRIRAQASNRVEITGEFKRRGSAAIAFIKAIRPHQWAKNGLIFLPLALSHQLADLSALTLVAAAFMAFSLCASSAYLLNDMLDLEADRQHEKKKLRPFAAGELSLVVGFIAIPLLLLAAALLSVILPLEFRLVLFGYFVLTLLYSFLLKAIMVVDVLTLAALYTIRIIAGAAAISVAPTFWLLGFSMFLFLSLAIVKRVTELEKLRFTGQEKVEGRGYAPDDLPIMAMLGSSSGFMAVLVFALYINDETTRNLYRFPVLLWFICPLLLYFISRIWVLAYRGSLHHDPVVFAIRDRNSILVAVLCAGLLWLATGAFGPFLG